MNKNKIMEAIFASFPDIVVYRHKSVVVPLAVIMAGVVGLAVQKGMDPLSSMRMVLLVASVTLAVIGGVMFLSRTFGNGEPYYIPGKCFLGYETLAFGGESRDAVLKALSSGSYKNLVAIPHGEASVITVALYTTPGHDFSAAMAFAYQDLEYKPITDAVRMS